MTLALALLAQPRGTAPAVAFWFVVGLGVVCVGLYYAMRGSLRRMRRNLGDPAPRRRGPQQRG